MKNDWFIDFVRKDIKTYGPEMDVVVIYEEDDDECIEDYEVNWSRDSKFDLYYIYGKDIKIMKLKDLLNELVL